MAISYDLEHGINRRFSQVYSCQSWGQVLGPSLGGKFGERIDSGKDTGIILQVRDIELAGMLAPAEPVP
jgi:hypothetical protein